MVLGVRNDPLFFISSGPRPPSDPHGCYPENKHIPGMGTFYLFYFVTVSVFPAVQTTLNTVLPPLSDMMGPRSSSPANLDGSVSHFWSKRDSLNIMPPFHL